ncbi:PAS domain-containing sensor histidine kinase [Nonlabens sp. MB-3u-79]|uniref:PAS domain-containing sensor histidine kinase n=1 Tax=Nonlabens sp. MB-3u-79 TaxID=2058134 RepID=UPI000C318D18|nr:PAS domain-containing sensor histidine kinase [Nonlabens sp. MB-3u-79]AUC80259.1 PAS domain-containing sensor histidine kinase [Nonlabens sp. MB-3u-79]
MGFFEESIDEAFLILFEGASEGIVVVNSAQIIVATNASARTIFGYEKRELEGQHLHTLIPSSYHKEHHSHFHGFMDHSQKREMGNGRDLFGLRKDGTQFPVEAGLNPFVLHNHRYVMSLVTDITVRKENERQIADLNDHLEEKIEERTDSLNKAVEQLKKEVSLRIHAENNTKEALQKEKELNELKTKFLSLVSHEFKTPISGILTSATLIGKYTTEEQQEKREKHLNTIKSKVKYLNTIIDDFLSLERLDTGKAIYKTTSFPLSKVLNEVVYDANMHLKEGQNIQYPKNAEDIIIAFDEKILELSLSNLIHNAIKYSGEGSLVIIEVNELPEHLEIKIKDQGIGIPQQEQHSIFDRYFRAENVLLTPGTGIGLNIVQNHLRNLDATISFISSAGKGSTFRILIPVINTSVS